jgi:integrase
MEQFKLNDRMIKALESPETGNRIFYDREVPGFGLRVTTAGAKSFVLTYWAGRRQRRYTIGRFPELSTTAAREEARQLRADVRNGGDPLADKEDRRNAPTISDLALDYLEHHALVRKRESSIAEDKSMLNRTILPGIGKLKVADVNRDDIEKLRNQLRETPYRANRVLSLLNVMFNRAVDKGWRPNNPCRGVERFHEEKRERWLDPEELNRLSQALYHHPNQSSANAVRLLILTGARRGEVLSAKWEDFDLRRGVWTKPSHHTKQKKTEHLPLNSVALKLLIPMKATAKREYVFPGEPGQPVKEIKKFWHSVCTAAEVKDARMHDLRHTFASLLVQRGVSLPIVGKLLGHTQVTTTARYAHHAHDSLRDASDQFAGLIGDALTPAAGGKP